MELILRKNELRDRDKTLICHPPISVLILSLRQSCRMRLASQFPQWTWSAGLGGVRAACKAWGKAESVTTTVPCAVGHGSNHRSKCGGGHKALAYN
jgi:hypothetical protein